MSDGVAAMPFVVQLRVCDANLKADTAGRNAACFQQRRIPPLACRSRGGGERGGQSERWRSGNVVGVSAPCLQRAFNHDRRNARRAFNFERAIVSQQCGPRAVSAQRAQERACKPRGVAKSEGGWRVRAAIRCVEHLMLSFRLLLVRLPSPEPPVALAVGKVGCFDCVM